MKNKAKDTAFRTLIDRLIDRIGFRSGVRLLFGSILLLGVAGAIADIRPGTWLRYFDLDREYTVPALFSGCLLLAAAWESFTAASSKRLGGWAFALAAVFFEMGFDELLMIHERIEQATGVDWQILYLPVMGFAGIAWLLVFIQLRDRQQRRLWIAGAIAWTASQLFEAAEWGWGAESKIALPGYLYLVHVEELLEMSGSSFFLLTLLLLNGGPPMSRK
ncbi:MULTISPECIES: hypothetical protein [Methylococcus]|jgi:hypothetical protein|uniref:Uncharacterized protein n=1 Tax=Methylococcus capsulatus TaxID=414 RepID=A0AA35UMR8_METCP|nr:hypothetical protein [Methylococcus capsulatus]CAI8731743.1 membrane protein of unknown function [Methylococcus capsulatus]